MGRSSRPRKSASSLSPAIHDATFQRALATRSGNLADGERWSVNYTLIYGSERGRSRGAMILKIRFVAIAVVCCSTGAGLTAQKAAPFPASEAETTVQELLQDERVREALASARASEERTIEDQIRFCEVPAPPFGEGLRGERLRQAFVGVGLENIRVDRVGNVLGERPGTAAGPRLVVATHLDTVFPEGTDVTVTRNRAVLQGPGIGDNCRGLAVLVAIAREIADVPTRGTIVFVANVGEEGLGDLRGVKTLFAETLQGRIDRFVSIDGAGIHITRVAVGSHRYKVTFSGPGGHSYGAFGMANPAHALGRAVAKIADLHVPSIPQATFNVGRVGGGTSVNSIPFEAWMEVDLRSSDPAALADLDRQFQEAVDSAALEENDRWGRIEEVTVVKELVGDRPAGSTPVDAPIVQVARAVAGALGIGVSLGEGSTDANLPMSLDIPAITVGAGGRGNGAHSLTESFDTTDSWRGTQNAVLLTLALAR